MSKCITIGLCTRCTIIMTCLFCLLQPGSCVVRRVQSSLRALSAAPLDAGANQRSAWRRRWRRAHLAGLGQSALLLPRKSRSYIICMDASDIIRHNIMCTTSEYTKSCYINCIVRSWHSFFSGPKQRHGDVISRVRDQSRPPVHKCYAFAVCDVLCGAGTVAR